MSRDIKKNLRDLYNRHARNRDAVDRPQWKTAEQRYALAAFQESNCRTLLEIGCGTGQDSLFFQQHGMNVTAIDFSEEQVKCCKEKRINALVMDVYALQFAPESFDAIYSLNCFLHVPKKDLPGVLNSVQQILKAGGLFYLGVYGGRNFEGMLKWTDHQEERFFAFYEMDDYCSVLMPIFQIKETREIKLSNDLIFHSFLLERRSTAV